MNLAFRPVGIISGLLAGIIGKKLFRLIWGRIDDEEAPDPQYRDISLGKLVLALLIEGALFSLLRGLVDHGARHAFAQFAGEWPGDERPERKDD